MTETASRPCKDCGRTLPETREYFGQFKNKRASGAIVIGFRNSCRECMAANTAQHTAANPDQHRARGERRAVREATANAKVDEADVARVRRALDDRCRYCDAGLNGAGEVDHLTPVRRGGSGRIGNITIACMPCNRAKLGKTLDEFLMWRAERGIPKREVGVPFEKPDPAVGVQRESY